MKWYVVLVSFVFLIFSSYAEPSKRTDLMNWRVFKGGIKDETELPICGEIAERFNQRIKIHSSDEWIERLPWRKIIADPKTTGLMPEAAYHAVAFEGSRKGQMSAGVYANLVSYQVSNSVLSRLVTSGGAFVFDEKLLLGGMQFGANVRADYWLCSEIVEFAGTVGNCEAAYALPIGEKVEELNQQMSVWNFPNPLEIDERGHVASAGSKGITKYYLAGVKDAPSVDFPFVAWVEPMPKVYLNRAAGEWRPDAIIAVTTPLYFDPSTDFTPHANDKIPARVGLFTLKRDVDCDLNREYLERCYSFHPITSCMVESYYKEPM
jgi:hypothetical protein